MYLFLCGSCILELFFVFFWFLVFSFCFFLCLFGFFKHFAVSVFFCLCWKDVFVFLDGLLDGVCDFL